MKSSINRLTKGGPHPASPCRKRGSNRRGTANCDRRGGSQNGAGSRMSEAVGFSFLPEMVSGLPIPPLFYRCQIPTFWQRRRMWRMKVGVARRMSSTGIVVPQFERELEGGWGLCERSGQGPCEQGGALVFGDYCSAAFSGARSVRAPSTSANPLPRAHKIQGRPRTSGGSGSVKPPLLCAGLCLSRPIGVAHARVGVCGIASVGLVAICGVRRQLPLPTIFFFVCHSPVRR